MHISPISSRLFCLVSALRPWLLAFPSLITQASPFEFRVLFLLFVSPLASHDFFVEMLGSHFSASSAWETCLFQKTWLFGMCGVVNQALDALVVQFVRHPLARPGARRHLRGEAPHQARVASVWMSARGPCPSPGSSRFASSGRQGSQALTSRSIGVWFLRRIADLIQAGARCGNAPSQDPEVSTTRWAQC